MFEILQAIKVREVVPFGSAFPSPDLFLCPNSRERSGSQCAGSSLIRWWSTYRLVIVN
jgi:hypothetical protein